MGLIKPTTLPITNEWFRNSCYLSKGGHTAFCSYVQILKRRGLDRISIINMEILLIELGLNKSSTHVRNQLSNSLAFLCKHKLINFFKDFKQEEQLTPDDVLHLKVSEIVYCSIPIISDRFTLIRVNEVQTIFNSDNKTSDKKALLAVMATLLSHINDKTKICYPSMELLIQEAKIGKLDTCSKLIEKLSSLGLIIYDNAGVRSYLQEDGSICLHQLANTYARPEDRELLECSINTLRERANFKPVSKKRKVMINEKRSITQQINNLKKTVHASQRDFTDIEIAYIQFLANKYNQINELLNVEEYIDPEEIIQSSTSHYSGDSERNSSAILIAAKNSDIRVINVNDDIPDDFFALSAIENGRELLFQT